MPELQSRLQVALADRYRIERELGAGGMATVYLARDLKHDRQVAVKVLRPELGAVLGAERFLAEVRITAGLDHPHILTLIDSGEADGLLYYVLPFIRGESLRDKLARDQQLGIDEALAITRQIAGALDHAHRQGVIHRDIKPENILLHEGEAMLADFGIALAVKEAGGNRLTETGLSLGTPQYMSPEQATGDRQLTARSDVYSLAAVCYEMLAGEPPVTGPNAQAMVAKLMTERPVSLRVVRDTVPEALDLAVQKALAKVPADRFASAGEFVHALETARAAPQKTSTRRGEHRRGPCPSAPLAPLGGRGRRPARARDRPLEVADTGSGPPGARAVGSADGGPGPGDPAGDLTRRQAGGLLRGQLVAHAGISPPGRWGPDDSALRRQHFRRDPSAVVSRRRQPALPHAWRRFALAGARRQLPGHRAGVGSRRTSRPRPGRRAAKEIAFARRDSVLVVPAGGGPTRVVGTGAFDLHSCAWSPDGKWIACVAGNSESVLPGTGFGNLAPSAIVLFPAGGGAPITVLEGTVVNQSPAWAPDGRRLLLISSRDGPRDIYALSLASSGRPTGEPVRLTTRAGCDLHVALRRWRAAGVRGLLGAGQPLVGAARRRRGSGAPRAPPS